MDPNHDFLVMGTAQDAVRAKYATAQAGYLQDPFVAPFLTAKKRGAGGPTPPQPPVQVIIKRGTFARVACVEGCIRRFLGLVAARNNSAGVDENAQVAQVLVLGAGKDTAFFRICSPMVGDGYPQDESIASSTSLPRIYKTLKIRWIEVDHDQVLREKASAIQQSPSVFGVTPVARQSESADTAAVYYELKPENDKPQGRATTRSLWNRKNVSCYWIAHDLKEEPSHLIDKLINAAGLDPQAPTLVVVECVQMYLPIDAVDALWSTLATTLSDCHVCSYEPIVGGSSNSSSHQQPSAFGRMMQANLTKAGVVHPDSCLVQRRTLAAYLSSWVRAGFARAVGCDMHTAYETLLTPAQRQQANRCEFLDELEEWILIMRHYGLVVASNNLESSVGKALTTVDSSSQESSVVSRGCGFVQGRCQTCERQGTPDC